MHCPDYDHKGSQDLSHTFHKMTTSVGIMDSEVHKVQEVWTGQKDLQAAHHMAKGSPKGIQFFQVVPPTESPRIRKLFPQSPLQAGGTVLLSMVWKGGA